MKKISVFVLGLLLVPHFTVAAQNTASPAAATSTTKADLDSEVSDAKLRADSGSKSKLSASLTSMYAGASAAKPFGDTRPQIGASDTDYPVSISGGFGARYRFNKNKSLYLSTGYTRELKNSDSVTDVSNPVIAFNNTFGLNDLQIGTSYAASFTTEDRSQKVGNFGTASARISALKDLNNSGLKGGLFAYVLYTYYRSGFERYEARQMDYATHFGPTLLYRFNDNFNFYTNVMTGFSHLKNRGDFHMDTDPTGSVTQSVGVGISPVRDFYLAPNASFYWNHFSAAQTAVNLSATINIF